MSGTTQRMRIAYLTTKYPAVSHTFIRREILELERRGHEVVRIAVREADAAPVDPADVQEQAKTTHILRQRGLVLGALGMMLRNPAGMWRAARAMLGMARRSDRGVVRHIAYLVEACFLLRFAREQGVRHVHVHFGTNAAAVALLARVMGGPTYSMTVHGPDEFDAPIGLSLKEKVEGAAFVAAITSYCAAQLKRWVGPGHWGKVKVVGCTVGDAFFDAATPLADSKELVCVGRLNAQKGHLLLIEAFAGLVRDGVDAKLVLAGDGELRRDIEAKIAAEGLAGSVEITGWIGEAEVRRRILGSRALVMASFAEGLPMVLMEALALGRPVLATAIAGIPELVEEGRTGWLVPAGDVNAMRERMRRVMAAPREELERMATAGRERVKRDHYTQTEGQKLERLLMEAVK